jgi:hypothetical protein
MRYYFNDGLKVLFLERHIHEIDSYLWLLYHCFLCCCWCILLLCSNSDRVIERLRDRAIFHEQLTVLSTLCFQFNLLLALKISCQLWLTHILRKLLITTLTLLREADLSFSIWPMLLFAASFSAFWRSVISSSSEVPLLYWKGFFSIRSSLYILSSDLSYYYYLNFWSWAVLKRHTCLIWRIYFAWVAAECPLCHPWSTSDPFYSIFTKKRDYLNALLSYFKFIFLSYWI